MTSVTNFHVGPRVQLGLDDQASAREYRELAAFVRACIERIERDVGRADWWTVNIARDRVSYCCDVIVQHCETVVRASSRGSDGAVAGGEAFRRLETLLHARGEQVICGCH